MNVDPEPGMNEVVPDVAAVVIGRNEGERLLRCLASLSGQVRRIVYVDSGSSDGSVDAARKAGAEVVVLDASIPFTAARGRNAGADWLQSSSAVPEFVQFIDGDCELQHSWIATAHEFLVENPNVAVVCGRIRERHPEASLWNRLIDAEWDTPAGEAAACGGNSMMRFSALRDAGGFNATLIAGEEPELCLRLRLAGWSIWRLDREMALHDIAMTRFSQWWRRSRRAGHAYAEGAFLHGGGPERFNVAETRRALLWGVGVPVVAIAGIFASPWALALLLAWPAQMIRLRFKGRDWPQAVFLTLGKIAEAQGVVEFHLHRLRGRRAGIIEYR